ncbi:P-loop containing nucleoside triphosphate hydrolase protein [Apiospora arundinis]|uniref:P-loop containing nucleoside triphosphate hydrolase protein n=1 Tax=Apiospora arundinis TaxID=335852 RepID=A0ABR2IWM2_9PEZI
MWGPGEGDSVVRDPIDRPIEPIEPSVPSVCLFQDLPSQCIVLIEDIDAAGIDRDGTDSEDAGNGSSKKKRKSGHNDSECTLSGILNALDGVGSQEGRIVIMTTNFPGKLDKALVRPGRIDKRIYIGYISRKSAKEMFVRMFQPLKKDKKANKSVSISTSNTAVQDGGYKGLSQASDAEHNPDQEKIYNWDVCSCDECKTIDLTTQAAEFAQLMPENSITPSELQGFFQARLGCPNKAMRQFRGWLCEMNAEKVKQR